MFLIRVYPVIAVSRSRCQIKVLVDRRMQIEPSPTPDATRFTDPCRTSPTADTPGRLVSSRTAPARASSALTVADRMPAAENL
jgi:hypothetical protein